MNQHVRPQLANPLPRMRNYPDPLLEKGDGLVIDGMWHQFIRRDPEGITVQVMDASGVQRRLGRKEFWELYYSHRLSIQRSALAAASMDAVVARLAARPLEAFSKDEVEKAMWKLFHVQFLERMQDEGRVGRVRLGYKKAAKMSAWLWRRQQAAEAGKPVHSLPLQIPGWSSLREWQWRYESSGKQLVSLVDGHSEKGTAGSRLDGRVEAIIAELVRTRFLTREEIPLAAVHEEICAHVMELNDRLPASDQLGEPAYSTVDGWIKRNYTIFDVTLARKGREAAIQKLKLVRKGPVGLWPMHTIQMDFARLDMFAVNKDGDPLFGTVERSRPWVVIAVCTLTGMIVGYHITFEPPCWQSAMACLRHAVMPKDLSSYKDIQSDYPCMGGFKIVMMDNDKAFRCQSLLIAVASLKAAVKWGPAGQARRRGKIERTFRTINHDFAAFTPGRSFHNVQARGDYEAEALAAFTLAEIHERFTRWVVDIHHNRSQAPFGLTPLQKWEKFGGAVHVLDKAADLDALLAITIQRTIQRQGIRVFGLRYRSPVLERLLQRSGGKGRQYAIKINPDDLMSVLLFNDVDEKWEYIPCVTPEYVEGIGLEEWRRQCVLARKLNGVGSPARRHLLEARRLLNEEAAARGAVPRKRLDEKELEYFRENTEDPVFDIVDEDRPRRRRKAGRATEADAVDTHVPAERAVDAAPAHRAAASVTPLAVHDPESWRGFKAEWE